MWDAHFGKLEVKPSGGARYKLTGSNDVLKRILLHEQKGRCWYQGSASCASRALLAREAQIDHVVPKTSRAEVLRLAAERSTYQSEYFDVHDPGNLGVICGPCNVEKGVYLPDYWSPAIAQRCVTIQKQRDTVIRRYRRWHDQSALDDAKLQMLRTMMLDDEVVREIYTDLAATMIENLAEQAGVKGSLRSWQEVEVATPGLVFTLRPSDDAIEAEAESRFEMMADDERHGL